MNDHVPIFSNKHYAFVIRENAQIHATVGQVTASDADKVSASSSFIIILMANSVKNCNT